MQWTAPPAGLAVLAVLFKEKSEVVSGAGCVSADCPLLVIGLKDVDHTTPDTLLRVSAKILIRQDGTVIQMDEFDLDNGRLKLCIL